MENYIIVSQLGARQRYQIPIAFYLSGCLKSFYTDFYNPFGSYLWRRSKFSNMKLFKKMLSRWSPALPQSVVHSNNLLGVQMATALSKQSDPIERSQIITAFGQKLANEVVKDIRKTKHSIFFGFCSESLEILEWEKSVGNFTILDQYDAANDEHLFLEESERWPGWGNSYRRAPSFYERVYAEWRLADIILVNSEWSRTNIIQQGADHQKIRVIPQPFYARKKTEKMRRNASKFRVIYVGAVNLRKGVQYLLSAASKLINDDIEFLIIGGIDMSEEIKSTCSPNIRFTGYLPYQEVQDYYQSSDVFVFPSLSDGFARVQLEAMSFGLPVIATTNCGKVVEHGKNGYIVPIRDADAIANCVRILYNDRSLLKEMSANAFETIKLFSLSAFNQSLVSITDEIAFRPNDTLKQ